METEQMSLPFFAKTPREIIRSWRLPIFAILMVLLGVACGYEGSLGQIACDDDGDCPDDAECVDDFCVYEEGEIVECEAPEIACEGICVDPDVDDDHCGSCGNACFEGEYCDAGSCVPETECDGGRTACGQLCVDLDSDDDHCGQCHASCGDDQYCDGGQCHCPGNQSACDDICVDTDSDVDYCGDCDTSCADGQFCYQGECSDDCDDEEPDQQLCDDQCINPQTNADHCGDCHRQCEPVSGATAECSDGQCSYTCDDENYGYCEGGDPADDTGQGRCVDLTSDTEHCGDCDVTCSDDGPEFSSPICTDGGCSFTCDGALSFCSADEPDVAEDSCADLDTSAEHCGSCGNTCDGDPNGAAYCDEGDCHLDCDEGFDECIEGSCTDLMANDDHCGFCGNDCDPGEQCVAGECEDLLPCDPSPESGDSYYPFGGGDGTDGDPHTICTAEQLQAIEDSTDYYDRHYILADHIDLSGMDFRPIARGNYVTGVGWIDRFRGDFDGNGYEIRDLTIEENSWQNRRGLFGFVSSGTLRNVVLVDVSVSGDDQVGGLVGRTASGGLIVDSSVSGIVTGNDSVGGLVGRNDGEITGSHSSAEVDSTGQSVGGLVGLNNDAGTTVCTIDDSHATGEVSGSGQVGGLVGYNSNDCSITASSATGDVMAPSASAVGGLVGWSRPYAVVIGSHAEGDVTGHNYVGGLAGRVSSVSGEDWNEDQAPVQNSHAEGQVTGNNYVGGLVGMLEGTIVDSYATGPASGNNDIGGLVGWVRITDWGSYGTILRSHAVGSTQGAGDYIGGLVGFHEGEIRESFASGNVVGNTSVGGLTGWVNEDGNHSAVVIDSYATGDVQGNTEVGGLIGRLWGGYQQTNPAPGAIYSYSFGLVTASDGGGLVGLSNYRPVVESYWRATMWTSDDTTGSESLTGTEFSEESSFYDPGDPEKNWDFTSTWEMAPSRPVLQDNPEP